MDQPTSPCHPTTPHRCARRLFNPVPMPAKILRTTRLPKPIGHRQRRAKQLPNHVPVPAHYPQHGHSAHCPPARPSQPVAQNAPQVFQPVGPLVVVRASEHRHNRVALWQVAGIGNEAPCGVKDHGLHLKARNALAPVEPCRQVYANIFSYRWEVR